MSNVFVVGTSGFIGSNLINYLSQINDLNVFSVGRNDEDFYFDLESSNFDELINNISIGDYVVLLAAISSPQICLNQKLYAQKLNVTNTLNLISKLEKKGVKVIFSSSDTVFGGCVDIALDDSKQCPFGPYAHMKTEVEESVRNFSNVKVIRFSYVLGMGDMYTTMLSKLQNTSDTPLEVYKGFERCVVVIDDVVLGIKNLIQNWTSISPKRINFCGQSIISREDITQLYHKYVDNSFKFSVVNAPLEFWKSRPKRIQMSSRIFPTLLNKQPMSIIEKFKNWNSI